MTAILRTITTSRGTAFKVVAEGRHYVACMEPTVPDMVAAVLLDLEELAAAGYLLAAIYHGIVILRREAELDCELCGRQRGGEA